ncbi:MAG: ATP-dependent DNA helicase RecG [Candidatus Omnitrophota bacterium]|nr:ATP-dependent DNA helicase RecG [Candidatus Omnitrophota bacterium]
MEETLNILVRYLKGVGPKKSELLGKIGIKTAEDMLYYFPRRYLNRSKAVAISQLKPGESQVIKAKVLASGQRSSWRKKGFSILEVAFGDETGKIYCVWFNQPYLKNYFKPGIEVILYGRIESYHGRLQMEPVEFEILKDAALNLDPIIPVYSLAEGITQRYFRKLIKSLLDKFIPKISEGLPYDIRKRHNLLNLAKSLIYIHFPPDEAAQKEVYRRLAFEEFFLYQIPIIMRKMKRTQKKGVIHKIGGPVFSSLIQNLPFSLTSAQERALLEIKKDMSVSSPMQRLLQGEVGSGKTAVAFLASAIAFDGGYQAAFMAPTEILAKQHYINIQQQISKIKNIKLKVSLLAGSLKKGEKEKIYNEIAEGRIDFVIGTHSLLEESVRFKNLGLVIIDEQHKFGVGQRALLPKKGNNPDCLIMTATPIPRTLSMTIYGDLDISVLDELPKGRILPKTILYSPDKRKEAYKIIEEKIKEGRQAYIVCPKIEEAEFSGAYSVLEVYRQAQEIFKGFKVGLVHGRLRQDEQDRVMSDFKRGEINVLVATTVLEVGIDVANASVMLIEEADCFGLTQLHQLRGRIGRGAWESYCLLIANPKNDDARERMRAIASLSDGFKISEEDLKIRGPGEFFGHRQHGLSELRIANPLTQMHLLKDAREEAYKLLRADPFLAERQNLALREILKKRFPEYEELMTVG